MYSIAVVAAAVFVFVFVFVVVVVVVVVVAVQHSYMNNSPNLFPQKWNFTIIIVAHLVKGHNSLRQSVTNPHTCISGPLSAPFFQWQSTDSSRIHSPRIKE